MAMIIMPLIWNETLQLQTRVDAMSAPFGRSTRLCQADLLLVCEWSPGSSSVDAWFMHSL